MLSGALKSCTQGALLLCLFAGCTSSDATPVSPSDAGAEAPVILTPILDAGGGLQDPPDASWRCPATNRCNYQTGQGCPASTTSCLPYVLEDGGIEPACFIPGTLQGGQTCMAGNDCVSGFACAAGVCRKLCCGADWISGCPTGEHCIREHVFAINGTTVPTGAELCYPVNNCDALNPASCTEPHTTCLIVDGTGATSCSPPGSGAAGDECPCLGGYTCVLGGCRRLCKAVEGGGTPSCPPEEGRCVHYDRDPTSVGECTRITPI
jgi:hypothetical protein